MTSVTVCDESDAGFGWISADPGWMGRAAHALLVGGGVWLVDPVDFDGLDDRIGSLGSPRAVLQLFGRHERDCGSLSARLGVPLLVSPETVPGTPFEAIRIKGPGGWRETALWWPERRTLIVSEALGTIRFFCAPGRPLGVHPVLRLLRPPSALLRFDPEHILVGHGRGLHDSAADALRSALHGARRELPALLPRLLTARRNPVV